MKLSDIIDVYGQKTTKTGKRRKKGAAAWAKEFKQYLIDNLQWVKDGPNAIQSPNSNMYAETTWNGLSFLNGAPDKTYWEIVVSQRNADSVDVDYNNRLLILDGQVALKV